jgi:SAM-dependent methyltransferase
MTNYKDQWVAEEVKKQNPKRILDIAYAHGPNLELTKLGIPLVSVDPLGRPAPGAECHTLDVNAVPLPFTDGSFDAVVMGCVLSHLSQPLKLLSEINRVLSEGGTLIVSSPNPHYYWEGVVNIFYHHFKGRVSKSKHIEHFFEFTRYTMRTILGRAGFTVVKEIGSTLQIVKTKIRLNVYAHPGIAFEIVYVAKKTGRPEAYTVIEEEGGKIVKLPTNLFN